MSTSSSSGIRPGETLPLQVSGLYKTFKNRTQENRILKNISLSAHKGELIAVMGPSGSGKSTLLHVIAGLTDATEGSVKVNGLDLRGLSDSRLTELRRREIGFIFQSFNLLSALSVEDNILLPMLADGREPDRTEMRKICDKLGIADKLKRNPSSLSGGEQQRVAIARALLPAPAIILADEPTGSLDSLAGQELCRLLRHFAEEEARTILLVTHEAAVAYWADRTIVLKDGRIAGEILRANAGSVHALADAYQDILAVQSDAE